MLLLRYQRQRQEEDGCHRSPKSHDMRRKFNDHEIHGESRRAATRGTLICIFVCGSLLLSLGLTVLFVGLLAPIPRKDPTPWLVIGPTCIVLGILVLLLSVEIILKLRKIAAASGIDGSDSPTPVPAKRGSRQSWGGTTDDPEEEKAVLSKPIPVIIHPAASLQALDPASLPGNVIDHKWICQPCDLHLIKLLLWLKELWNERKLWWWDVNCKVEVVMVRG